MPLIITVAGPVELDSAILRVGGYLSEVKYSVESPIITPAIKPERTAQ